MGQIVLPEISIDSLPPALVSALADSLGARPASAAVIGGGYTPALRLRVVLEDGRSIFVKAATGDLTAVWLRTEAHIYEALAGASFLAERLAWHDQEGLTCLVLEDLSAAHWPPSWSPRQIDQVLETLDAIHASRPRIPFPLPPIEDEPDFASWHRVADHPEPFLSLGLCSAEWLQRALPTLIAAERAAPLGGDDLLHLDVRSDNICFAPDGRTVFVDWNWSSRGNGELDIAGWLSSLHSEGGPRPETILPDAGPFAALFSGFWAFHAGTPPPSGAPRVRDVQKSQLGVALPWAVRALALPPLDGPIAFLPPRR